MNLNKIFNNKKINKTKLLNAGFEQINDLFVQNFDVFNGDFKMTVKIKTPNIVESEMIEIETGEIYTLHLTDALGNFVGQIREEYKNILQNIAENCFDSNVFKSDYANKIINYVKEKYNNEPEFLWEKFAGNAIVRRNDNKKWYLILLTVTKNKLGIDSDEIAEVIDLRVDSNCLQNLIEQGNIYPGYHMNKKHWVSIILDGSLHIEKIFKMIDDSYCLAKKNK